MTPEEIDKMRDFVDHAAALQATVERLESVVAAAKVMTRVDFIFGGGDEPPAIFHQKPRGRLERVCCMSDLKGWQELVREWLVKLVETRLAEKQAELAKLRFEDWVAEGDGHGND